MAKGVFGLLFVAHVWLAASLTVADDLTPRLKPQDYQDDSQDDCEDEYTIGNQEKERHISRHADDSQRDRYQEQD